ncbi:MAG: peptidyl-prolyl cis-trans isomerase [Melioribacteraceae bacterium]|nr:peptidyl-prolyl cis-trans isomerase [Melioribacteraceae bacterium]
MYRIDKLFFLVLLGFNTTYAATYTFSESRNKSINNYLNQADNIVATVDTIQITTDEFYNSYEYGPAFIKRGAESKKKHLNYIINEKLLALYGYSNSIDTLEQVVEMYNSIHHDIMTEELFRDDILENISISESEIDTVVIQKQLVLQIKWLFSKDEKRIFEQRELLTKGDNFDTLYNRELKNGLLLDDRSMTTNRYQLGKKNPFLAKIIDTLQIGKVSSPINTNDGWYLIKLESASRNVFTTETEYNKLRVEAENAIKKIKMDKVSDKYVHNILLTHNPVIKRDAITILKSYLGKFILPSEKYDEWNLEQSLTNTTNKLDDLYKSNISNLPLVKLNTGNITLDEFLKWYRNREQYIKFNKTNIKTFSSSVENLVWRMVRDKLLINLAIERKYDKQTSVIEESQWWKDKIVYSAVRNELGNSILIENKEIATGKLDKSGEDKITQEMEKELSIKIFRLVANLKQKYKIEINENLLNNIQVSSENDPTAIEIFTVKKGGLIPRMPYPTIDRDWESWE